MNNLNAVSGLSSLVDVLRWHGQNSTDAQATTFLNNQGEAIATLTYGQLDSRCQTIGAQLQQLSSQAGERALIILPPGMDYLTSFIGCVYAGVIPVALYPPQSPKHMERIRTVIEDCNATILICSDAVKNRICANSRSQALVETIESRQMSWLLVDQMDDQREAQPHTSWQAPNSGRQDIAFLQYTSGSTGQPKGVMVTHDNIFHNIQLQLNKLPESMPRVYVAWVPLYHDLGLIGFALCSLFAGDHYVFMSPVDFLQKPYLWLKAMSDYQGTLGGGPSFAYDLCLQKISAEQRQTLDLSHWALASCGGEVVRHKTMQEFIETFADCGFRPEAFHPAYGMAETTLLISCKTALTQVRTLFIDSEKASLGEVSQVCDHASVNAKAVVSHGTPESDHGLVIVEPQNFKRLGEGQIGEIWLTGPSVTAGYWQNPQATEQVYHGRIEGEDQTHYLRTGDLGFIDQGELFITGRMKELLIVNGVNYYPYDIELSVEGVHPALASNAAAVFSVDSEAGESLVIVQELKRTWLRNFNAEAIFAAMSHAVNVEHNLLLSTLVLIKPQRLAKTSSGKIQRRSCKQMFIDGTLEPVKIINTQPCLPVIDELPVTSTAKASDKQLRLLALSEAILRSLPNGQLLAPLSFDTELFSLGLDSLSAIEFKTKLEQRLAQVGCTVALDSGFLFEYQDMRELIGAISQQLSGSLSELDGDIGEVCSSTVVARPEQRFEPFGLNHVQQAYWFGRGDDFELGNVATHFYAELDCVDLDLERFEQAWQRLIARHDMLRMVVISHTEQKILASVPRYQLPTDDLRHYSSEQTQVHLARVRRRLSHQVLDLENWPPFELHACRLSDHHSRLYLSFDAIVFDVWSCFILFKELSQFYRDIDSPMEPLSLSFRDYCKTTEQQQPSLEYLKAQQYWQGRIATLPSGPDLPLAIAPSQIAKPEFVRHQANMNGDQWAKLKAIAQQHGLTPSVLLLSCFSKVLQRWSRNPHFTLVLTLFNRQAVHPQVNEVVGDFTSLSLLEVSPDNGAFFAAAKALQLQMWRDLEHKAYDGISVLRDQAKEQGKSAGLATPVVFTSTLSLNNQGADSLFNNDFGQMVYALSQTPQVWLDHQVYEHNGQLSYNWDVVQGLFPVGLIEAMFASYQQLLSQLLEVAQPQVQLPPSQLAMRQTVNQTSAPIPSQLLQQLFLQQKDHSADQLALICADQRLSYHQLYHQANGLAHHLLEQGVRAGDNVGVCLEPGWQQVVAVIAVLLANGVYLPIDADLPQERIEYLVEKGQTVQLIVSSQWLAQRRIDAPVVVFDQLHFDHRQLAPIKPQRQPDDLAYIIFTSGSTGQPKGVAISHRGAVNTIVDVNRRFEVNQQDRVLALSALNFDLSVYDIFGLLACGGTIVMPDQDKRREPAHWLALIQTHQVTLWNTVPALMQMLVDHLQDSHQSVSSLRTVMMSGDWVPTTLPAKIEQCCPRAKSYSLGGATEASIWSIIYPIAYVDSNAPSIPYGKPMDNQGFHVLDPHFLACPDWVVGQLYISGVGLAREYWQEPAKTAEAFVNHPLTGERLYKTGDLGRYLPDGNIEFIGREDTQIKLRGYRIELGEIEAAIAAHPRVEQVVVSVVGEGSARQLAAYYTGQAMDSQLLDKFDFKLQSHNLRQDLETRKMVALTPRVTDEAYIARFYERVSAKGFDQQVLTLQQLSDYLGGLSQLQGQDDLLGKYRYPSAGSSYPVQTYVAVKAGRVTGLEAGIYYYHPVVHQLVEINAGEFIEREHYAKIAKHNGSLFDEAAFGLYLVANLDAIEPLYGRHGRDMALLEAGYMGQLLMETAIEHALGITPIGYMDFEAVKCHFDLNDNSPLLHSFLVGKRQAQQSAMYSLTELGLKTFIKDKLADYMVPQHFIKLDAIPLSVNGKVDRKQLPLPQATPQQALGEISATEKVVQQLFVELLKIEGFGLDDSFFTIGGDSVIAARMITRLRQHFQIDMPMRTIFDKDTITKLAQEIDLQVAQSGDQDDDFLMGEI